MPKVSNFYLLGSPASQAKLISQLQPHLAEFQPVEFVELHKLAPQVQESLFAKDEYLQAGNPETNWDLQASNTISHLRLLQRVALDPNIPDTDLICVVESGSFLAANWLRHVHQLEGIFEHNKQLCLLMLASNQVKDFSRRQSESAFAEVDIPTVPHFIANAQDYLDSDQTVAFVTEFTNLGSTAYLISKAAFKEQVAKFVPVDKILQLSQRAESQALKALKAPQGASNFFLSDLSSAELKNSELFQARFTEYFSAGLAELDIGALKRPSFKSGELQHFFELGVASVAHSSPAVAVKAVGLVNEALLSWEQVGNLLLQDAQLFNFSYHNLADIEVQFEQHQLITKAEYDNLLDNLKEGEWSHSWIERLLPNYITRNRPGYVQEQLQLFFANYNPGIGHNYVERMRKYVLVTTNYHQDLQSPAYGKFLQGQGMAEFTPWYLPTSADAGFMNYMSQAKTLGSFKRLANPFVLQQEYALNKLFANIASDRTLDDNDYVLVTSDLSMFAPGWQDRLEHILQTSALAKFNNNIIMLGKTEQGDFRKLDNDQLKLAKIYPVEKDNLDTQVEFLLPQQLSFYDRQLDASYLETEAQIFDEFLGVRIKIILESFARFMRQVSMGWENLTPEEFSTIRGWLNARSDVVKSDEFKQNISELQGIQEQVQPAMVGAPLAYAVFAWIETQVIEYANQQARLLQNLEGAEALQFLGGQLSAGHLSAGHLSDSQLQNLWVQGWRRATTQLLGSYAQQGTGEAQIEVQAQVENLPVADLLLDFAYQQAYAEYQAFKANTNFPTFSGLNITWLYEQWHLFAYNIGQGKNIPEVYVALVSQLKPTELLEEKELSNVLHDYYFRLANPNASEKLQQAVSQAEFLASPISHTQVVGTSKPASDSTRKLSRAELLDLVYASLPPQDIDDGEARAENRAEKKSQQYHPTSANPEQSNIPTLQSQVYVAKNGTTYVGKDVAEFKFLGFRLVQELDAYREQIYSIASRLMEESQALNEYLAPLIDEAYYALPDWNKEAMENSQELVYRLDALLQRQNTLMMQSYSLASDKALCWLLSINEIFAFTKDPESKAYKNRNDLTAENKEYLSTLSAEDFALEYKKLWKSKTTDFSLNLEHSLSEVWEMFQEVEADPPMYIYEAIEGLKGFHGRIQSLFQSWNSLEQLGCEGFDIARFLTRFPTQALANISVLGMVNLLPGVAVGWDFQPHSQQLLSVTTFNHAGYHTFAIRAGAIRKYAERIAQENLNPERVGELFADVYNSIIMVNPPLAVLNQSVQAQIQWEQLQPAGIGQRARPEINTQQLSYQNPHAIPDYVTPLRKYLVNLKSQPERLEFMAKQVNLNDFTIVEAVDGRLLTEDQAREVFDFDRFWRETTDRDPVPGEIGCTLSHCQIYLDILNDDSIAEDEWVLIIEDDSKFVPNWEDKLNKVLHYVHQHQLTELNLLLGAHIFFTSEEKISQRELKSIMNLFTNDESAMYVAEDVGLSYLTSYFPHGSSCYLVRKGALRKHQEDFKFPFWVADDFSRVVDFSMNSYAVINPCLSNQDTELYSTISDDRIKLIEESRKAMRSIPLYFEGNFIENYKWVIQNSLSEAEIRAKYPGWNIMPKVNWRTMPQAEFERMYDKEGFVKKYGYEPSDEDINRALTHYKAYVQAQSMANNAIQFCLFVEDDADVHPDIFNIANLYLKYIDTRLNLMINVCIFSNNLVTDQPWAKHTREEINRQTQAGIPEDLFYEINPAASIYYINAKPRTGAAAYMSNTFHFTELQMDKRRVAWLYDDFPEVFGFPVNSIVHSTPSFALSRELKLNIQNSGAELPPIPSKSPAWKDQVEAKDETETKAADNADANAENQDK